MLQRIVRLAITVLVGSLLLYVSRFWPFELWSGAGLLGWSALPPDGDLLARWLRGTPGAPFGLITWAALAFSSLTLLQRLFDRLDH
jgi:hypothetical protein